VRHVLLLRAYKGVNRLETKMDNRMQIV